ncbi:hypothetical protein AV530_012139 [Patagioenas fasciata monilis]|uniref:Reverse transcriptase/retrotransposon-derived protein RNase H-like domain-containing protein n=1 Tax=Patagioenas fasciata monilis TaxID=372326 RepID=A0A1V4JV18_PATFA|nr:hypothetical protein AV530_012139 [Patagioenas fasciata monilis]
MEPSGTMRNLAGGASPQADWGVAGEVDWIQPALVAGDNGSTWSPWQKASGESRGRPLVFWSQGYKESKAKYAPTEKEILAAYEGV